jgi:hypothetical protein
MNVDDSLSRRRKLPGAAGQISQHVVFHVALEGAFAIELVYQQMVNQQARKIAMDRARKMKFVKCQVVIVSCFRHF